MNTAIERLRASKAQYILSQERWGKEAGRKWALDTAVYDDLERLSKYEPSDLGQPSMGLVSAVDPDRSLEREEVAMHCSGADDWPSEEYVASFIEGAQELYEEVKDDL